MGQSQDRQIRKGNLIFDSENKVWVSKKGNKKEFNLIVAREKRKFQKSLQESIDSEK